LQERIAHRRSGGHAVAVHLQPDLPAVQMLQHTQQAREVGFQPVEVDHHHGVAGAEKLQHAIEHRGDLVALRPEIRAFAAELLERGVIVVVGLASPESESYQHFSPCFSCLEPRNSRAVSHPTRRWFCSYHAHRPHCWRAVDLRELTRRGAMVMPTRPKRGGSPVKHGALAPTLHWDNARIFLEVVRSGSFRSAAERLGESISLVRRRINDLEREVGTMLFTRDAHGTHLTDEGVEMVAAVERMEHASLGMLRGNVATSGVTGETRVAVTEGLGTFWLAPRLVEFQRRYPNTLIDLHCDMRSVDILRLEADISVQLSRPTAPDVKAIKIGRLHLAFFASPSYLKTHGQPKNQEELRRHRFVLQAPEPTSAHQIYKVLFPEPLPRNLVVMRNNVSTGNYIAIAKGAGIGLLPTYAAAVTDAIVPLDFDFTYSFDIWLSSHPVGNRIPRVRDAIEWIIGAFNPKRYPWFRDEYIQPKKLPKIADADPLLDLLAKLSVD
jgi:DNA-binding transcriptional LysR family regulator